MSIEKYSWLNKSIKKNPIENLPSSIIIEGESGLAKSKLAQYFSKQLLCSDLNHECQGCNSCSYYDAESHPDYCYLTSETCSTGLHAVSKEKNEKIISKRIDGIRALNEFMSLTNSVSKRRVAVIFDAHLMNVQAQNALLKTLEELPINKFIILVSDKRKYFQPTIYSRSNLISVNNPPSTEIDLWITKQGHIDYSSLNFSPDSTPLEIEHLINSNSAEQYQEITQKLNLYCSGRLAPSDLLKFFKDLTISYELKINSIIIFLKTCLGISQKFYKPHPLFKSLENNLIDEKSLSDLIEELIDYKVGLIKVPSLNEQIGLSNFVFKVKKIFSSQ